MDLQQLINEYRRRAGDTAVPPFVSDDDLAPIAAEAEQEACVRARLLYDDASPGVATYPITAGQAIVTLDASVDRITEASFLPASGGRRRELELTGLDYMQDQCDWTARTSSRPGYLAHYDVSKARIWPTPSVAGTLYLSVYRMPLWPIEDLDDEPEIAATHHMGLVDWILYRVFSRVDMELYDPQRAELAIKEFTDRFGERPSADVRRRQRERRRVTTRPYTG
ncbi:MAG: hypothetical protein HOQ02_04390 [Lysobacter sp.]|nr:hypothetical protein [Lysobacter sp.]